MNNLNQCWRTMQLRKRRRFNDDPLFRADFLKMCRAIGVDPLSSNKGAFKGLFSQTSKEYYYRLATQVSSIWLVLKDKNGGYLSISDCIKYLKRLSKHNDEVNEEDVIKAIQVLGKDLKGTFSILPGNIISCVPFGMNEDYQKVLEYFNDKFTMKNLKDKGFSQHQAESVIDSMLESGMICEDVQWPAKSLNNSNIIESAGTTLYWIISKATDESDIENNLKDIKNQDEMMVKSDEDEEASEDNDSD